MTRDEAKQALSEAAAAINLAASILRPHMELFETYKEQRQEMENFGHIFDPTLYRDPERRAAVSHWISFSNVGLQKLQRKNSLLVSRSFHDGKDQR